MKKKTSWVRFGAAAGLTTGSAVPATPAPAASTPGASAGGTGRTARPTLAPRRPVWPRVLVLALAAVSILSGLSAGLLRLGVWSPLAIPGLAANHGPLMVLGFVSTAIGLERAVALRRAWAGLAPLGTACGALAILAGAPLAVSGGFFLLGTGTLTCIYVAVYQRQSAIAVLVQGLGAAAALASALAYTRGLLPEDIVLWWVAFLLLTIIGERLELARIAFLGRGGEESILWAALLLMTTTAWASLSPLAARSVGISIALIIALTVSQDVARRTIRANGAPRFMAAAMLAGYCWALVCALVLLVSEDWKGDGHYDVVVHTIMLGFVISMILAHAPVIVPALVHRALPYHRVMWVPLGLLHASLAMRVAGGLTDTLVARNVGGVLGVIAILTFLLTTVTLVLKGDAK
ncbi:MAG: hypothetical protein QM705_00790 [Ancrocorticia sp.]